MSGQRKRSALGRAGEPAGVGARWEAGSDFHLVSDGSAARYPWTDRPHVLFGSGRDALRALLAQGRRTEGWRRLLVPSYYCQDILPALGRVIPLAYYPSSPVEPARAVPAAAGDVVLVASILGLSTRPRVPAGIPVIEDHSHDPLSEWAWSGHSDYAIASLRKTLPLPDGGVCWSRTGRLLPDEPAMTPEHARAALDRLSAMALKAAYLAGAPVAKADFRHAASSGEAAIGRGAPSGISPYSRARLGTLPANEWRLDRERNRRVLAALLGDLPRARVLDTPFAVTLILETPAERDRAVRRLVACDVYPAVLWPIDAGVAGVPPGDVELSRRILSLHCDFRYTLGDMERVAAIVRRELGDPR